MVGSAYQTIRQLANIFSDWLPVVLQSLKPYFSPDNEKGARWAGVIAGELDSSDVGLLFLTRNNLTMPWIMFEAGALAKKLDQSRVTPILFGVRNSDVVAPISHFTTAPFEKEEIRKLMETLNTALNERGLPEGALHKTFEMWWPDLEKNVNEVLEGHTEDAAVPMRSLDDKVEETLELMRQMIGDQSRLGAIRPGASIPPTASPEEAAMMHDIETAMGFFAEKLFYLLRAGELPPDIKAIVGEARRFIATRERLLQTRDGLVFVGGGPQRTNGPH